MFTTGNVAVESKRSNNIRRSSAPPRIMQYIAANTHGDDDDARNEARNGGMTLK